MVMLRPPAPPPLPPDKVSPGHVKRRRKRWARPRSYRREFMRTHVGLQDEILANERRKLRAYVWTRRLMTLAAVAAVVILYTFLMRYR